MKRSIHYILAHLNALISSSTQLCRNPISTLLTIIVLGVALALPTGLLVLTQNMFSASQHWETGTQVSLFLKKTISNVQAQELVKTLNARNDIETVVFQTAAESLAEFRAYSGFGESLEVLQDNPLPAVISVTPKQTVMSEENAKHFLDSLRAYDAVDKAQLDLEWLQRLGLILKFTHRLIIILAVLFSSAVLLIIGNTLRLNIQNEKETIIVTKIIGATDAFVRRPFLYAGSVYGLLGAIVCWAITFCVTWVLAKPVATLAHSYHSNFHLDMMTSAQTLFLIACGITLGWLGAWLSVNRHIKAIEPT